jgi:PKD repeat protein
MRKTLSIMLLLIASMVFFQSCKEEKAIEPDISLQYPVAAFTFSGNDGPAPVTVQFINKSETIVTDSCVYTWTFGENGPQSNIKNPSYTFSNSSSETKIYLVTLEVQDLVSGLSQARSLGVEIQGAGK